MNVVTLLAHPDDELMCAGTLAKFVDRGDVVTLVVMFVDERRAELEVSAKTLGVCLPLVVGLDERSFSWSKEWVEPVDEMVSALQPDVLISHRAEDTNHSHAYLARVARTVTRRNRWALWECDQALPGGLEPDASPANLLVSITEQLERKQMAVDAYQSQLDRYPGWRQAILDRDRLNGWQMNMTESPTYAEAFRVHKAVWA